MKGNHLELIEGLQNLTNLYLDNLAFHRSKVNREKELINHHYQHFVVNMHYRNIFQYKLYFFREKLLSIIPNILVLYMT